MAKSQDAKKTEKKEPLKTAKEKKAEKRDKKNTPKRDKKSPEQSGLLFYNSSGKIFPGFRILLWSKTRFILSINSKWALEKAISIKFFCT